MLNLPLHNYLVVDMSGVAMLSRLALRPGLRSTSTGTGLRTISASLSNKTTSATPNARLRAAVGVSGSLSKERLFNGTSKGWGLPRMVSTSTTTSGQESAAGGNKLRIAIIGQSMFGRDVSRCTYGQYVTLPFLSPP